MLGFCSLSIGVDVTHWNYDAECQDDCQYNTNCHDLYTPGAAQFQHMMSQNKELNHIDRKEGISDLN